jgi:hypothetical protein
LLGRALDTRITGEFPTHACLDDHTIAALAAGALEAPERARALSHVAGCARCRDAVASVARALNDREVARELAALEPRRRHFTIAMPITAAAIVLLALALPRWLEQGSTHRAPPGALQPAPVPLAPIGTVAEAKALRWRSLGAADRYRATVFDQGGHVRYETQLADTVAALPDSLTLVPGRQYLWLVEGRIAQDRWSASDLVRFTIAAGARP